jgi:hypothetical protein
MIAIYELPQVIKEELASNITVDTNQLHDVTRWACYNGTIPLPLQGHINWLLAHVLPRPSRIGDEPLEISLIGQSDINIILWLLLNYNDLPSGYERILLRTTKDGDTGRVGYGIMVPAACHPDSIKVLQRNLLLDFGWMDSAPEDSKKEPRTSFRIPADGHGGRFYQLGWVDESLPVSEVAKLPETTYRGPLLDLMSLSTDAKSALLELSEAQLAFEAAWTDASRTSGPVDVVHSKRGHGELCPRRMHESISISC